MISLRQFANMANVSPATISRAFSKNGNVLPETRERILSLARTYGFSPTCARPSSVNGSTRSVGLLLPTLGISYFSDIALGVQRSLAIRDFLAITVESRAFADGDRAALKRLLEHSVDGLIIDITNESVSRDEFQRLTNFDGPIIQVESRRTGFTTDVVSTDDLEGGCLAAKHLLDLGHRRIAFCRYGEGQSTCEARFAGFKSALDAYGVRFDPSFEFALSPSHSDRDKRFGESLKAGLSLPPELRPTAIFAPMDPMTVVIYEVATSLGLKIPDDLSVVGYSDFALAQLMSPKLTTIRQDGIAIGAEAARLFFERIDKADVPLRDVRIPIELSLRASTGPCPSNR